MSQQITEHSEPSSRMSEIRDETGRDLGGEINTVVPYRQRHQAWLNDHFACQGAIPCRSFEKCDAGHYVYHMMTSAPPFNICQLRIVLHGLRLLI
jgi:hypothetical protein